MVDEIIFLKKEIDSKNKKINNLKKLNEEQNDEISFLKNKNKQLNNHKNEISRLKRKNKQLTNEKNEILSSTSWKLTSPIRKFKQIFKAKKVNQSSKMDSRSQSDINDYNNAKKNLFLVKNIYSPLNYQDHYKTYVTSDTIKRVNIFLDKIDNTIFEFKSLFSFLINYCNKYDYSLRIIYNKADFELFNKFFKKNNFLLSNVIFLNLKKENYLEIGLNEKYVCTSWRNAKKLINTHCINSNIFIFLGDLDEYSRKELFQISNVCYNDNIIILKDKFSNLNKLKRFKYKFDIKINKKIKNRTLCCDFDGLNQEGIDLLNYLFLNNLTDWKIYIKSKQDISNLYYDSNEIITLVRENVDNFDLNLKLSNNKININVSNENYANIYLDNKKDEIFNGLDISDVEKIDAFDNFIPSKFNKKNPLSVIEEIFDSINEAN